MQQILPQSTSNRDTVPRILVTLTAVPNVYLISADPAEEERLQPIARIVLDVIVGALALEAERLT